MPMSTLTISRIPSAAARLDDIAAHVIAVANAVGNVKVRSPATKFNRGFQNDDGGGAVDIVVAINENRFFALDGSIQPLDGCLPSPS